MYSLVYNLYSLVSKLYSLVLFNLYPVVVHFYSIVFNLYSVVLFNLSGSTKSLTPLSTPLDQSVRRVQHIICTWRLWMSAHKISRQQSEYLECKPERIVFHQDATAGQILARLDSSISNLMRTGVCAFTPSTVSVFVFAPSPFWTAIGFSSKPTEKTWKGWLLGFRDPFSILPDASPM